MSDAPISQHDYNELKTTLRELAMATNRLSQQLAVHNAEQKSFEVMVTQHDIILRGRDENIGLIAKTNKLEISMENINKAAWAFFAPAIALVFIGILTAIYIAIGGKTP